MKSHEELVKEGFKLLYSGRANEIYSLLLSKPYTETELSKIVYPHLHIQEKPEDDKKLQLKANKRKPKFPRGDRPSPMVARYLTAFVALDWIVPDKKRGFNRNIHYTATFKPYFEYLKSKNSKIKFSKEEEKLVIENIEGVYRYHKYDFKNGFYSVTDKCLKDHLLKTYLEGIYILNKPSMAKDLSKISSEEVMIVKLIKLLHEPFVVGLTVNYLTQLSKRLNKDSKKYKFILSLIKEFQKNHLPENKKYVYPSEDIIAE